MEKFNYTLPVLRANLKAFFKSIDHLPTVTIQGIDHKGQDCYCLCAIEYENPHCLFQLGKVFEYETSLI